MRLEIGNFHVKDIVFGDELSFRDGVLTINKEEALNFIREDERITEADLYIVKPGDEVRLCPVKDALSPGFAPTAGAFSPATPASCCQPVKALSMP